MSGQKSASSKDGLTVSLRLVQFSFLLAGFSRSIVVSLRLIRSCLLGNYLNLQWWPGDHQHFSSYCDMPIFLVVVLFTWPITSFEEAVAELDQYIFPLDCCRTSWTSDLIILSHMARLMKSSRSQTGLSCSLVEEIHLMLKTITDFKRWGAQKDF